MTHIHFKQQTDYTCGPACMRIILASAGIKKSEQWLARFMKTDKRIGTKTDYFPKVADFFHLKHYTKYGVGLTGITKALKNGHTVITLMYVPAFKTAHYSMAKKINRDYVYLHDPWFGPYRRLDKNTFIKNWHDNTHRKTKTRWLFAIKNR